MRKKQLTFKRGTQSMRDTSEHLGNNRLGRRKMLMKQVDMLSFVRGVLRVWKLRAETSHVRVERPDELAMQEVVVDCCFMGDRDCGEANARCMPI